MLIARFLATHEFPLKPFVEALFALPLVLPPTVLGYYLLVALGADSLPGRWYEWLTGRTLVFTFDGLLVASVIFNLPFAIQPLQRAFEAIPEDVLHAAACCGLTSPQSLWRIELPLIGAGPAHRRRAHLRAHAGRVRRRADGGRQHPRRDQDDRDRDLRPRAGLRHDRARA